MINFEQALNICKQTNTFYYKEETINDETFIIFNYRLATYDDFKKYNAYELRGLTFNKKTKERFLSINKFFNINEHEEISFDKLKEKTFYVKDKLDGSLIQVINVNGEIYPKTKNTFFSEQAKIAKKFLDENQNYKDFIYEMWSLNLEPLFELVSPFNQIVLFYPKTKLILIQLREKTTGMYIPVEAFSHLCEKRKIDYINFNKVLSLNEILNEIQNLEGIEGYVIHNAENLNEMYKVKTEWYLRMHRLIADEIKENDIISLTLEEKIDDVLMSMPDGEKKNYVLQVRQIVSDYVDNVINDIIEKLKTKKNFKDRKEFALYYKEYDFFPILMKLYPEEKIDEQKILNLVSQEIIKRTQKLKDARKFLEKIKLSKDFS